MMSKSLYKVCETIRESLLPSTQIVLVIRCHNMKARKMAAKTYSVTGKEKQSQRDGKMSRTEVISIMVVYPESSQNCTYIVFKALMPS